MTYIIQQAKLNSLVPYGHKSLMALKPMDSGGLSLNLQLVTIQFTVQLYIAFSVSPSENAYYFLILFYKGAVKNK